MDTITKSFKAVNLKALTDYDIPKTSIVNITNYSTSTDTITVLDKYSGDTFELQVGETITLNWGFLNNELKITTKTSTGRVIYYK